jgi:hypothetical protein
LAVVTAVFGVLPSLALLPTIGWLGAVEGLLLRPGAEAPGYAPPVLAGLTLIVASSVYWGMRRGGAAEVRREPMWADGFAAPPPWLPFGDPATQIGPASFAQPLRQVLAGVPRPVLPSVRLTSWRDALLSWLAAP